MSKDDVDRVVEQVAKVLFEDDKIFTKLGKWADIQECDKNWFRNYARGAITAMPVQEPAEEVLDRAFNALVHPNRLKPSKHMRAALARALKLEPGSMAMSQDTPSIPETTQAAYARGWAARGIQDAEIADVVADEMDVRAIEASELITPRFRYAEGCANRIAAAIRAVPDPVGLVAREGDGGKVALVARAEGGAGVEGVT